MTAPIPQPQPVSEHTPTPWMQITLHPHCILGAGQLGRHAFSLSADYILERANPDAAKELVETNAAFIVEAVNSHASLKARVEELEAALRECAEARMPREARLIARAALQPKGAA